MTKADEYLDNVLFPLVGMGAQTVLPLLEARRELTLRYQYYDPHASRGLNASLVLLADWLSSKEWYEVVIGDGWVQKAALAYHHAGRPAYALPGKAVPHQPALPLGVEPIRRRNVLPPGYATWVEVWQALQAHGNPRYWHVKASERGELVEYYVDEDHAQLMALEELYSERTKTVKTTDT